MKIGTQTASLTNHIMSRETIGQPEPVDGMGATVLAWTDRYACTIMSVSHIGKTTIWLREDHAKMISGDYYNPGKYEYTPNPHGRVYVFQKQDNGKWNEMITNPKTGRLNKERGGNGLKIGVRQKYNDPHF